ncbi:hypothetical protein F4604DRAFT_1780043 [Suillus subluteus]|nr:hypothetical protein F4604DRAFT_1780043 [Suillus subluteus]
MLMTKFSLFLTVTPSTTFFCSTTSCQGVQTRVLHDTVPVNTSSLAGLAPMPLSSSVSLFPLHRATLAAMQPGIYKFINRQSDTARNLAKNDYTSVVVMFANRKCQCSY